MNRLFSFFKRIRVSQILTVFLAGVLLFVTTACGGGGQMQAKGLGSDVNFGDNPREEVPSPTSVSPKNPVVTSRPKGGMNTFSDVDPRADVSKANTKAKALKDNAERNVIDQTDDIGTNTRRILDKKGENAEHFGENVQESTEATANRLQKSAKDFAKGTQRGTENLRENTQDAARRTSQAAEDASDNVQYQAGEAARNAQRSFGS